MLKKCDYPMKRRFSKSLGRRTHSNPNASISTLDEDDSLQLIDKLHHDPFLLILDQVQDPRNLGACLRTADGAGVDLVILPNDRSAGITEVVRHVAAAHEACAQRRRRRGAHERRRPTRPDGESGVEHGRRRGVGGQAAAAEPTGGATAGRASVARRCGWLHADNDARGAEPTGREAGAVERRERRATRREINDDDRRQRHHLHGREQR